MMMESSTAASQGYVTTSKEERIDADLPLVRAVQSGCASAFDELVKRHRNRIFSVLYHLTGNREDAADLAQETFLRAFKGIRSFRGGAQFYTWLYRIGVNLALKQLRRNRLRQFFSFNELEVESGSEEFFEALREKFSTERALFLDELREKIGEALQQLSPKHRTTIILAEIEGLGSEEISKIMDCSMGTVRSRIHYAKEKLKVSLGRYLEG